MINQTVIYSLNPAAGDKAAEIIETAKETLGQIQGTTLTIGRALESRHAVVASNGKIIKTTSWKNKEDWQTYRESPKLREWCRFILRGWQLKDSTAPDLAEEFTDHILSGGEKREWTIIEGYDPTHVLWAGEEIYLSTVSGAYIKPFSVPYALSMLEKMSGGTNSNWAERFCRPFAEVAHARSQMGPGEFADWLAIRALEYIGEGAPGDLKINVGQIAKRIVELYVDDKDFQTDVYDMFKEKYYA